ncbi:MAG: hypothetical protein IKD08_04090 [Alphaproteobacteria bacterium]|nr:hypothetical protein [Alphaproteobacteria bacterium]
MPNGLKELICRDCNSLIVIKDLPESLEELDCSACSCLTELQNLPKSLKELNCMAVRIWSRLTEFLRPSKRLPLTMELNIFRITFRIIK